MQWECEPSPHKPLVHTRVRLRASEVCYAQARTGLVTPVPACPPPRHREGEAGSCLSAVGLGEAEGGSSTLPLTQHPLPDQQRCVFK